jgi:hypothetical protein
MLFIEVSKHVEWLHGNIGSIQSALEQGPKNFDSVCVYSAFYVAGHVANEVMHVITVECFVGWQFIAVKEPAGSEVLFHGTPTISVKRSLICQAYTSAAIWKLYSSLLLLDKLQILRLHGLRTINEMGSTPF